MNFVEFIEGIARVAEKLSYIHQEEVASEWRLDERINQPLHHKIENLITVI